ncbi:VOC family protein [Larkinella insperata]|uniref:VOC family protein n=1 Tax=Larkinella insperata TaxID=332158 RepID=A0ABW3QAD3_9BACT|nr:VOC family protein [Larkinella insperata]
MARFNPYLNFNGNTEEAFNFYKSVFGGEFVMVQRFKEMQQTPGMGQVSEEDANKILHIALPLSKNTILMGTDALESMGQRLVVGNNFYLSVSTDTKEQADQFFKALSDGGLVEMPMDITFWGAYYGSLTDKFGIQWQISYDKNYSE